MPKNQPLWINYKDSEPEPVTKVQKPPAPKPKRGFWDRVLKIEEPDTPPTQSKTFWQWVGQDHYEIWRAHNYNLRMKRAGKPYDSSKILAVGHRPFAWVMSILDGPYHGSNHRGSPW